MEMESNDIEKGIITRIYLENFVTYNRVVIKPGRNLNVIIGPNGTGKSTIVCAIVLGLGGDVDVIGRARHLKDYIKNGCKEAKIEIELKESDNSNVVITRLFTSDKSTWLINGKLTSSKNIYDVIANFNIQVNNLCQFLPQDKVQDFSKMNSQELLENTEKSVGDTTLVKFHTKLKDYRTQHKMLENQIATKKKLLESQTQKYNSLKEIVGNIKERKLIKKKIISLKQKKAWIIYDQMRKKCKESKEKRDAAAIKMDNLNAQLHPIDQEISKLNSDIRSLKDSINYCNRKNSVKTLEIKKIINTISDYESMVKEYESACQRKIQAEQTRDEEINTERQHKSKLENDLSHMMNEVVSEETLLKQQQDIVSHMEKQRKDITSLTELCNTLKQKEEDINHTIKAEEDELRFCNIESKRLELLKQRSPDAYKGVLWLKDNQNRFSAPIHEPMLLHINVKNSMYAKYLENFIPVRDLLAFICENKQDMNLLLKYLRDELKLQVNAVHSDPLKQVHMQPNIPLQNIKQFGFNYYLISLIDAPSTVMKYLVSMYHLHNIPVGSKAVEDNVAHIPQSLSCYFSESNIYAVSLSKYSAEKSTKISTVRGNGLLSIIVDTSKIENIKKKIQVYREEKNEVISKIRTLEETISRKNEEFSNHRAMKNKYQQSIQQIQALRSRIRMAEEKITVLNNDRTTIEEINASTTSDIQISINKQLNVYRQFNLLLEEYFNIVTDVEENELSLMVYQRCLVKQENSIQELREEYTATEREFKQLDEKLIPLKNEAKKLYNEALNLSNGISPQDPGFKSLNTIFSKLPTTIEDIIKEITMAQAKVFCMENNVDGENILHEYEEAESDIVRLKEAIQTETSELIAKCQKMEKLREQWLVPLKHLIEQINMNFSSHFETMKCAGEVTLHHGENIMDFDQYGLKIKVKFRDGDELQELTRYHQSGGERAVTTAIYMIALQELSTVPFRCVDEINQGMDATNERRVFELLVKITGKPQSSQYFLLTPKLLPGLLYTDTVTVHCVFNGPFMIPDTDFEIQQYCTQINRSVNRKSKGRNY